LHGDVLLSVNALKDARAWLDRALALDGTYAPTLASLGQLHARLEDNEAALAILRPAAAAAPDYFGLQYYLGSALIEAKDYEGAAEASQIATTLSPDSGRAWLQHSVALLGLDRLAASDAALARAAEADPRSVWFFGRAGAAWRQGRDRVAIDDVAAGRLSEVSAHGRAYAALLAALASWRVREPELAVPLLMEAREAADNGTWTSSTSPWTAWKAPNC
jgi:tetratricopeptide (TPR) repeat protein